MNHLQSSCYTCYYGTSSTSRFSFLSGVLCAVHYHSVHKSVSTLWLFTESCYVCGSIQSAAGAVSCQLAAREVKAATTMTKSRKKQIYGAPHASWATSLQSIASVSMVVLAVASVPQLCGCRMLLLLFPSSVDAGCCSFCSPALWMQDAVASVPQLYGCRMLLLLFPSSVDAGCCSFCSPALWMQDAVASVPQLCGCRML